MLPWDEIRMEVEHAQAQLQVFDQTVKAWCAKNPTRVGPKLYKKGKGQYDLLLVAQVPGSPPLSLAVLAGEIIHHIYSALDHAVFQLSRDRAPSLKALETVEFPIFLDGNKFMARDLRGKPTRGSGLYKIRFVQPAARAIIKRVQPYQDRLSGHLHALWALYQLERVSKHRHLTLLNNTWGRVRILAGPLDKVQYEIVSTEYLAGIDRSDFQKEQRGFVIPRPLLKDGAVVARYVIRTLPGFDGKVQMQHYAPPEVGFSEGLPLPMMDASQLMGGIGYHIVQYVLMPLQPYFPTTPYQAGVRL